MNPFQNEQDMSDELVRVARNEDGLTGQWFVSALEDAAVNFAEARDIADNTGLMPKGDSE